MARNNFKPLLKMGPVPKFGIGAGTGGPVLQHGHEENYRYNCTRVLSMLTVRDWSPNLCVGEVNGGLA